VTLLFDQNLSYRLCRQLNDLFPNSQHVVRTGLRDADDRIVWRYARDHDLAIVSLDSDFAEMSALNPPPPKVIWLRCGNQPTAVVEQLLRRSAEPIAAFLEDEVAACLEIY